MKRRYAVLALIPLVLLALGAAKRVRQDAGKQFLGNAQTNADMMIRQGKQIFRFDTFGDQAFWGDQLKLHQAINTLTPRNALALGLKVDAGALPQSVIDAIKNGKVNLDDPAVTLQLLKANAVLGVVGFFND